MIIRRDCKTAALSILAALTLSLASSPEAAGRERNQDHRGPNLGGRAIPGGPSISWGHSFDPHGARTRPRDQDHRATGAHIPPVVGTGGRPQPKHHGGGRCSGYPNCN